jgi:hypothetical protein
MDSMGNEENGYPVPDPNKIKINITKEPHDDHKKALKDEIWEELTEKIMEKILDIYGEDTRIYKMHSRNFKTPTIKKKK